MTPLVSVIVPVHNVVPWLPACLESLLAQTEPDIEILAVDDGSTDGSGALCERYAAEDPRVRVIHKANGGLSDARNAGLAEANAEWVMFLDGDDWIDPEAVHAMLGAGMDSAAEVVVAGFHVDVHEGDGVLVRTERRAPERLVIEVGERLPEASVELLNVIGYAWNKLYRRTLLDELGARFPVGVSLVEDILFNAPVLAGAKRVTFLDEAFVHYVQRRRPTLGTTHQPEFAQLMSRATEETARLLETWGVAPGRVAELMHAVEVTRVQWALHSMLTGGGGNRSRLSAARRLLGEPLVRRVLEREVAMGRHRGPRGWLLATQARGYALPTMLVLRARSALR
jgi:cellulose synthase/poly-beta-1,6-N-acetylglucosamine synthase-like glycosyltransferase